MSDQLIIGLSTLGVTLVSTIATLFVNYRLGVVHKQINSRMDEFLKAQKALGNAEGKAEGRAEKKEEMKNGT